MVEKLQQKEGIAILCYGTIFIQVFCLFCFFVFVFLVPWYILLTFEREVLTQFVRRQRAENGPWLNFC